MALADRRKAGPPKAQKPCCKLGAILADIDPSERAEAEAMMADKEWSAGALQTAFNAEGIAVSDVTIHRHRTNTRGHVAR